MKQSKKLIATIKKFNKKILKIFKKILDKPPPLWYNISTKIERYKEMFKVVITRENTMKNGHETIVSTAVDTMQFDNLEQALEVAQNFYNRGAIDVKIIEKI